MDDKSNLYLIGLTGSGKTTVGLALAKRLKVPFIDTDREIVKLAGKPIPEILETEGEALFRHHEGRVIRALSARKGVVAALGSGALSREMNRLRLGVSGRLVWLDFPSAVLADRLARQHSSPQWTDMGARDRARALEKLLETRRQHYATAQHILRFTQETPLEEVVCRVLGCLDFPAQS